MKSSRFIFAVLLQGMLYLGCGFIRAEEVEGRHVYMRYVGDDKRGKLETAVVRMERKGVVVALTGAVHIADASYYEALTKSFAQYDALLFELVDGQNIKDAPPKSKQPAEDSVESSPDPAGRIIHEGMKKAGQFLKLHFQSDGIDYHTKNFVHADVSWDRFHELQQAKGESWFTLFQRAIRAEISKGASGKQPEVRLGMLVAGALGDPSALKVGLARQMAGADNLEAVFAGEQGESVIIGERNNRALEVLDEQLQTGKHTLGIFYGAGHLGDMEKKLTNSGWTRVDEKWNTAWTIEPKPKIAPDSP